MKGNFKTLYKKFCLDGTVLGLKYLYLYPNKVSRCFWVVALSAILCFAFLVTFLLYQRFQKMPTRISIENEYEPIENFPYPAITICSPNQMTISAVEHFTRSLVDGNLTLDLKEVLPQLLSFYKLAGFLNMDSLEQLQRLVNVNRYTLLSVMGLLPQSCDQFLKLCYFKQQHYTHCRGLFKPILTSHGLCCIFNNIYHYKNRWRNEIDPHPNKRTITRGGLADGLTVISDYDPGNAMNGTILHSGAIKIMFTDWSEFPTDEESTMIEPHTESMNHIHTTYTYCSDEVKALPVSSRNCYFGDEYRLPYFYHYRNSDCNMYCYLRSVERNCYCTLFYVPYVRLEKACNVSSIPCIMNVSIGVNKWLNTGRCECPRDCDSRKYTVETTVGNLAAIRHMYSKIYSGVIVNKSTTIMHFFTPSSVYIKRKQETVMSLISLTSNLGGVFSLCLGYSVISILEILFYVYAAIRNSLRKRT